MQENMLAKKAINTKRERSTPTPPSLQLSHHPTRIVLVHREWHVVELQTQN